jgi:xanthine/uracil permease
VIPLTWKQVDAQADPDFVVAPDERLDWARTAGIGAQHVVAMFGATFLVPVLTGFPPATTLLFSGVGTVLFLIITGNRLPSYLGSSFSVIAPVTAVASNGTGSALGGLVAVGVALIVVGLVVHVVGTHWIDVTLPPVVTGAIVALIGFNLAPAAKANSEKGPLGRARHAGAAGRHPGLLPRHHRQARDLPRRRRGLCPRADPRRRRHVGDRRRVVDRLAGSKRRPSPSLCCRCSCPP